MPLKKCQTNNEPGWKWGDSGFCYRYTPNSKSSETRARKRALAQALAIGDFIEEYKGLFNALESFQESYDDYPDSVKNNAQRGIDLNKEVNNKCATALISRAHLDGGMVEHLLPGIVELPLPRVVQEALLSQTDCLLGCCMNT